MVKLNIMQILNKYSKGDTNFVLSFIMIKKSYKPQSVVDFKTVQQAMPQVQQQQVERLLESNLKSF